MLKYCLFVYFSVFFCLANPPQISTNFNFASEYSGNINFSVQVTDDASLKEVEVLLCYTLPSTPPGVFSEDCSTSIRLIDHPQAFFADQSIWKFNLQDQITDSGELDVWWVTQKFPNANDYEIMISAKDYDDNISVWSSGLLTVVNLPDIDPPTCTQNWPVEGARIRDIAGGTIDPNTGILFYSFASSTGFRDIIHGQVDWNDNFGGTILGLYYFLNGEQIVEVCVNDIYLPSAYGYGLFGGEFHQMEPGNYTYQMIFNDNWGNYTVAPVINFSVDLPGDVDGDCDVDIDDLSVLLIDFGMTYDWVDAFDGIFHDSDFNVDGKIDVSDLSILLSQFGLSFDC